MYRAPKRRFDIARVGGVPHIAPGIFPATRPSRGLFPLCLGRQSLIGPAAIGIRVIPIHPGDRVIRAIETRVAPIGGRMGFVGRFIGVAITVLVVVYSSQKPGVLTVGHLKAVDVISTEINNLLGRLTGKVIAKLCLQRFCSRCGRTPQKRRPPARKHGGLINIMHIDARLCMLAEPLG